MMQKQNVMLREVETAAPGSAESAMMTAAYIAELTGELEKLAARDGMEPLTRILRLARVEARRMSAIAA